MKLGRNIPKERTLQSQGLHMMYKAPVFVEKLPAVTVQCHSPSDKSSIFMHTYTYVRMHVGARTEMWSASFLDGV